ncbi:Uncharacterised protein [uncultured archaeon]|nr:Uncharacterised protein [uncultured archaeon]
MGLWGNLASWRAPAAKTTETIRPEAKYVWSAENPTLGLMTKNRVRGRIPQVFNAFKKETNQKAEVTC